MCSPHHFFHFSGVRPFYLKSDNGFRPPPFHISVGVCIHMNWSKLNLRIRDFCFIIRNYTQAHTLPRM